jgi:phosphopentomutase
VPPPAATILDAIAAAGGRTIAIGKIEDIFCGRGITHSIHTKGNTHGLAVTHQALRGELSSPELTTVDDSRCLPDRGDFIFVNLVDTDSLYGHRRDPAGYGRALEEIDTALGQMLPDLGEDDLLIITGDHGCDPTAPGTDHTREYVPLLIYRKGTAAEALGTLPSFTAVAETVARWLAVPFSMP